MDFAQVKELIQLLDASSLTELRLVTESGSVVLSKNASVGETHGTTHGTAQAAVQATQAAPPQASTLQSDEPITILPEPKQEQKAGRLITSPLVGTFYASASPDKPPFAAVGGAVRAGQVLCIIEAMKVMNEITADADGTIAEVLAANEQLVEYGQPLFRII